MIIDHVRNKEELKRLYSSRPMPNQYDFKWLINNPNLFCFYGEKKGDLRGFITVQEEEVEGFNGKVLTLSGTSVRGNMADNIQAIITVCNAFDDDMYSLTPLKHAELVLKKAGFTKIGNNLFVRYKNGKIKQSTELCDRKL
jgi:hypothetical protein